MKTIVITTTNSLWDTAREQGSYTWSTIDSRLDDVGFIHATSPGQTIDMLNRHFTGRDDIILLLVNADLVEPEIQLEKALSGREGPFPHIYGPLNIDAVYEVIKPEKDAEGNFVQPTSLAELNK